LFPDLDAGEQQYRVPDRLHQRQEGLGRHLVTRHLGYRPQAVVRVIVDRIPAPTFDPEHPLQAVGDQSSTHRNI
jgi:hypothetical protein